MEADHQYQRAGSGPEAAAGAEKSGAFGFTFHIDTSQIRRDSQGTVESEHDALRLKFAQMLAAEGGLTCSFNLTVSSATLDQVPGVVQWAQRHPTS